MQRRRRAPRQETEAKIPRNRAISMRGRIPRKDLYIIPAGRRLQFSIRFVQSRGPLRKKKVHSVAFLSVVRERQLFLLLRDRRTLLLLARFFQEVRSRIAARGPQFLDWLHQGRFLFLRYLLACARFLFQVIVFYRSGCGYPFLFRKEKNCKEVLRSA